MKAISGFATSPNAKTILFPVEATQLIGTIGGISELAREALGGHADAATAKEKPSQIVASPFAAERTRNGGGLATGDGPRGS